MAIYFLTSHRKGFSSCQLARDLGVTQQTAWFMLHRIRHVLDQSQSPPLGNVVEVDESYMGGKARRIKSKPVKRGRGSQNKVAVMGIVERDGAVRAFPIHKVDRETLHKKIHEHVEPNSVVMTDDYHAYKDLKDFIHERVNHSRGEYARDNVHTNTIEGFWGLMKRGYVGVYHYISSKHLSAYCDEFTFRYSTREDSTFVRFNKTLARSEKRLTYRTLKSKDDEFNKRKPKPSFGDAKKDREAKGMFESELDFD